MKKIIMDADAGTDDAIAIMLATMSPEIEVVAICSVFGNASVRCTTENALRSAHAAGGDGIPVYPGAAEPLVKNLTPSRAIAVPEPVLEGSCEINGATVRMNPDLLPLPESPRRAEVMEAALFYVDFFRRTRERVSIVATGALTNLALALILAPDIAPRIERIVIMGGGVMKSNITSAAEANFFKDPEAAATVLRCGAPIVLCTLDATHSCSMTGEHEARIRSVGGQCAEFTANDICVRRMSYRRFQPLERSDTAPIHDALCVAWLIDPTVALECRDCRCDVDCSEGLCEGHLQVDTRARAPAPNVHLITCADPDKLCDIIVNTFLSEEAHA